MSQALHPAILEEGGLDSAVEWLVSTTQRHAGLDVTYKKTGDPFAVDSDHGIHIYRVLQEALNNVARHSGARAVRVGLRYGPSAIELEVEDPGRGFSPETPSRGIGLTAMRERAEILGGTITFSGAPSSERGTLVRLVVPREAVRFD
jgi:signal transduction histidine kinase